MASAAMSIILLRRILLFDAHRHALSATFSDLISRDLRTKGIHNRFGGSLFIASVSAGHQQAPFQSKEGAFAEKDVAGPCQIKQDDCCWS